MRSGTGSAFPSTTQTGCERCRREQTQDLAGFSSNPCSSLSEAQPDVHLTQRETQMWHCWVNGWTRGSQRFFPILMILVPLPALDQNWAPSPQHPTHGSVRWWVTSSASLGPPQIHRICFIFSKQLDSPHFSLFTMTMVK